LSYELLIISGPRYTKCQFAVDGTVEMGDYNTSRNMGNTTTTRSADSLKQRLKQKKIANKYNSRPIDIGKVISGLGCVAGWVLLSWVGNRWRIIVFIGLVWVMGLKWQTIHVVHIRLYVTCRYRVASIEYRKALSFCENLKHAFEHILQVI